MTAEVALTEPASLELAVESTEQVQGLLDWAQAARAAHTVALSLVKTSFVPSGFRGKPDEATAAILAGMEIGLQPMAALRSFDVIQGIAAPRALTLRAIVQSRGHKIEITESTPTLCVARGKRREDTTWQTVEWPIERAVKLGVTTKDNWIKQPQAMLVARATSEIARLIAADALLGIGGYSAEEIADSDQTGPDSGPAANAVVTLDAIRAQANRRRNREITAQNTPTPTTAETRPAEDAPSTPEQQQQIVVAFDEDEVPANERPARIAQIIGRETTSPTDLTAGEADQILAELNATDAVVVEELPADADDPTLEADWGKQS
jgi:hypothetical protein